MGELHPVYPLVAAARYLGVAPWELEQQSVMWTHLAHAFASAEAHAQEMANK